MPHRVAASAADSGEMKRVAMGLGAVLVSACSSAPTTYGPSMLVLPGTGKTFEHFRLDEQDCRADAQSQISKASAEQDSAGTPQQRYDRSFVQCMYAKGHKVPVTGRFSDYIVATQSTARNAPPPPAGKPPAEAPPDLRPTR